ncbi:phosphatase PAP2 family protein [Clostridium botulinum]|uniref:PAP2 family protein n=1 Tax=Clostridium botulinum (strain Okra / Type B1) TaxID=498213 RepID=B1IF11_CLOBK|nr:phosphatase PAP2 family protein [Clostridium botulinum]EKX80821.1 PAP2 family protein [Clostridium botulinum CFSAN001628]ACA46553.1 PAP2 family protein [Clostridium botulinum B1 str. Okra]MBD5561826.1 phosphatase PAP2 family protein [Clostridium botulinum]MBD5565034.1 phosphatase PAP2 family protein [Clostridium botulinum]MBD5571088.1 phosphatase PAP2 family protein [Clostridium botulinum]
MNFIQNIDIYLLDFIHKSIANDFLDKIMIFITSIGNLGLIWIAISVLLLISKKYRRVGMLCTASLILSSLIGEVVLKNLVQRGRPFTAIEGINLLIKAPKSFSFPSGHTASSFAVAIVIGRKIKSFKLPIYILAFAIAFSRLYLYVHYPSDVLVGALIGIISANIILYIYNKQNF